MKAGSLAGCGWFVCAAAVLLVAARVPEDAEPREAVTCALDIEARATAAPAFPAVRAGIHYGPVLYREGDYGATVNLAARAVAEADRHQILITEAVRGKVHDAADLEIVRLPKRTVKG